MPLLARRQLLALFAAAPLAAHAAGVPALMLANRYRAGIRLQDYWVSEKMDGIRGYWDGRQFWTRSGRRIPAPAWFTANWPAEPLDGELWAGRGHFDKAAALVRPQPAPDSAWREVRFMVFDLPSRRNSFTERLAVLNGILSNVDSPWVRPVAQSRVDSRAALTTWMRTVVRGGGEGLILHRGDAPYTTGHSDDLLKLKPFDDADARIVAHLPGRGKAAASVVALIAETTDGKRFQLSDGLDDAELQHPPPVGSWVSYRLDGMNADGTPRSPIFLRERPDL